MLRRGALRGEIGRPCFLKLQVGKALAGGGFGGKGKGKAGDRAREIRGGFIGGKKDELKERVQEFMKEL